MHDWPAWVHGEDSEHWEKEKPPSGEPASGFMGSGVRQMLLLQNWPLGHATDDEHCAVPVWPGDWHRPLRQ
jgi:hypothetical protein